MVSRIAKAMAKNKGRAIAARITALLANIPLISSLSACSCNSEAAYMPTNETPIAPRKGTYFVMPAFAKLKNAIDKMLITSDRRLDRDIHLFRRN